MVATYKSNTVWVTNLRRVSLVHNLTKQTYFQSDEQEECLYTVKPAINEIPQK